jgi:hypothetical protein
LSLCNLEELVRVPPVVEKSRQKKMMMMKKYKWKKRKWNT